jgi:hypothetical protein
METIWLTLTNLALGIVTLVCIALVVRAILKDLRRRSSDKKLARIGRTMADGGESARPQRR